MKFMPLITEAEGARVEGIAGRDSTADLRAGHQEPVLQNL
jgi:hypothetical protein